MGDKKRFDLFAKLIEEHLHIKDKNVKIADVASGKGYLQMSLRERGYKNIKSWDKRYKNKKDRNVDHKYGYFTENCKENYAVIVAMHPDEATDHCVLYAIKNKCICFIVPCCIKPSARIYNGRHNYNDWIKYLANLANKGGMIVERHILKMSGKNICLIIKPKIK